MILTSKRIPFHNFLMHSMALSLILLLVMGCEKKTVTPPPSKSASRTTPDQTHPPPLASRLPRQYVPWNPQQVISAQPVARLFVDSSPTQIKVGYPFTIKLRAIDAVGKPVMKSDVPAVLSVVEGGSRLNQGRTSAMIKNGEIVFTDVVLDKTGGHVLSVAVGGTSVTLPKILSTADRKAPATVRIEGRAYQATYIPPNKFEVDGDVYENVPFGESYAVIEGVYYKVFRDINNNLEVRRLKAPPAKFSKKIKEEQEKNK